MIKSFLLAGVAVVFTLSFASAQNCDDITLSITPDTTICGPGASVTLSGTSNIEPFDWSWVPDEGLSATNQPAVIAQPAVTTTYTLSTRTIRENLIFNGNFALGAVGFTTDYSTASGGPNGPLDSEGEYMVDDNPNDTHQNFAACGDHTTGDGNMLVVNSSANQDRVWCQVVSVTPNTTYAFSAWATSVFPVNPASLQFSFDGLLLGDVFNATPNVCDWQQFFATWNSGNNTDVEICITNVNSEASGNDFAIDDVAFGEICEVSAEVTVSVGEELPAPQPDCEATSSSITLSWPAVAGATGYQVDVLNAPAGSFTADTVYTIDGLAPGQSVNVELFSVQGECTGAAGLFSCATLACPDYEIEVLSYDSLICEGSPATVELAVNTMSDGPFSLALDRNGTPLILEDLNGGINTIELGITENSTLTFISFTDSTFSNCTVSALPTPLEISVESEPEAGQDPFYEACAGTQAVLVLDDLMQGADAGGLWVPVSAGLGGAFDSLAGTLDVSGLNEGTYQLAYIVDAAACNSDTADLSLTILPIPLANAGADYTLDCIDTEVRLGQSDSGQGWRYAWQNIQGPPVQPGDSPQITVSEAGVYVLQVLDPNTGCSALDTAVVEDISSSPLPVLLVQQSNCPGENTGAIIVDTVFNGNGPFVYSLDGENFGAKGEFTNLPAGQYELTVQDIGGCEGTATALINANNSFTATITATPDATAVQGESVGLSVDYFLSAGQLASISWWPAPDTCQGCPQITVMPERSQLYIVTLTDDQGCVVRDTINIRVLQERRVYAPSAFSPNDDGVNDRYYFQTAPEFIRGIECRIFNRWGNMVFEAKDFNLNDPLAGWDGTFNGEYLQAGVYTFQATLELSGSRSYQFAGSLHLIR